ncbi:uncharacterized protein LOC131810997 [Mustela lutreola]|uniref:uncharacterized protein LOC131810997 n=1 Tax=Mustela lutreola TaxID=9666 RepID=UPI002797945D|nr:uncharacterized protein LOC131810997 [Mustela lutreola]
MARPAAASSQSRQGGPQTHSFLPPVVGGWLLGSAPLRPPSACLASQRARILALSQPGRSSHKRLTHRVVSGKANPWFAGASEHSDSQASPRSARPSPGSNSGQFFSWYFRQVSSSFPVTPDSVAADLLFAPACAEVHGHVALGGARFILPLSSVPSPPQSGKAFGPGRLPFPLPTRHVLSLASSRSHSAFLGLGLGTLRAAGQTPPPGPDVAHSGEMIRERPRRRRVYREGRHRGKKKTKGKRRKLEYGEKCWTEIKR